MVGLELSVIKNRMNAGLTPGFPKYTKANPTSMNKRFLKKIWSDSNPFLLQEALSEYRNFLRSAGSKFPKEVFEFALADWHYDGSDSRCPKDSWLVSMNLIESPNSGEMSIRHNAVELKLLGANHDGHLQITYHNVADYCLSRNQTSVRDGMTLDFTGHGDWLIDEFSLSSEGKVVHYIEFSNSTLWEIHFETLCYDWIPI